MENVALSHYKPENSYQISIYLFFATSSMSPFEGQGKTKINSSLFFEEVRLLSYEMFKLRKSRWERQIATQVWAAKARPLSTGFPGGTITA